MTTLRQGERGPAVRELQLLLLMTGHDPGPIDGVFGPRTLGAFEAWYSLPEALTSVTDGDFAALRALPRRAVEVPRILTPITAVDMRIALVAGYVTAMGERDMARGDISDRVDYGNPVRVALAQLAVEHGCEGLYGKEWTELVLERRLTTAWLTPFQAGAPTYIYVWDFNIGNRQVRREDYAVTGIAHTRPMSATAVAVGAPTVSWFSMSPTEGSGSSSHLATSAHYAYPNASEGAAAYWRFLRDHCGPALAAFEAGDPARAAHELKVGAWRYSGDEAAYTQAMVDRFKTIV